MSEELSEQSEEAVGMAGWGAEAVCNASAESTRSVPRWKRVVKRVAVGVSVIGAALLMIGAVLYSFGGMERPARDYRVAYEQLVAQGRATPVQSRFVIPIPGCRCHSTDAAAQMEHSLYRIKDCRGCH